MIRAYGPTAAFCPRCGARLSGAPPVDCAGCGYALFLNARPTANVVVVRGDRFLALRRARQPRSGHWALPGGFCDGWEHPADAAVREAREELGVEVVLGDLIGMHLGSYDFQDEVLPVLDVFYFATLGEEMITLDPAEASELAWLPLRQPPRLAFRTMDAAVRDARGRLGIESV